MRGIWITYRVGRDAKTGHFISLAEAKRRKATATIETVTYWRKR